MAVSRVFSRSHLLLRAGASCVRVTPSAIPSISSSLPRRAFTSSAQMWEDIVQTPSRGPEISLTDNRSESAGNTANSIALLKISRRLSRGEIEEFLKSRGFNIKKVQLRVDRFSFQNDTNCFVELGSAEEAQKAVQELNRSKLHQHQIVVAPLKPDFRWGSVETPGRYGSRYFINEGNAAEEALCPLMEGRRVILSVETPGWTPELGIRDSRNKGMEIIAENFDQYGIERVSDLSVFYGDKKAHPRMLCSIDFKTKEGAEQAAADKHNAVINGRVVWVKSSEPSPWRVQQFWKTAPKIVEEMQEKGLLSKDMYEDKFTNPLPKKNKKSKQ